MERDLSPAVATTQSAPARSAAGARAWVKGGFVLLFLLLLVIALVQQRFTVIPLQPLDEQREQAPRPRLSLAAVSAGAYMAAFDTYYNDQAGFRELLIRVNNDVHRRVLGVSPKPKVILGKAGWLYWRETVKDFRKEYSFSTERALNRFCKRLIKLQGQLQARGVDFLFVIVPNKNSIYPEYMPDKYPRVEGTNLCELLEEKLRGTNVRLLYLKPVLQKHLGEGMLYERKGTHWTYLGAYYGAAEILRELGEMCGLHYEVPQRPPCKKVARSGDLEAMVQGLVPYSEQYLRPDIVPAARDGKKLPPTLWYGDSFSNHLDQYLTPQFRSVKRLHLLQEPMNSTLQRNLPGRKLVLFVVIERSVRNAFLYQEFPDLDAPPAAPPTQQ